MSCDKPGRPQLCHLERLTGRRWCGGEMQSSLVHGPQGPRGRRHSPVLCTSSAFPSHPQRCYLCRRAKYPCCAEAAIFL